eukprot:808034-Amphidinium_carterae.1
MQACQARALRKAVARAPHLVDCEGLVIYGNASPSKRSNAATMIMSGQLLNHSMGFSCEMCIQIVTMCRKHCIFAAIAMTCEELCFHRARVQNGNCKWRPCSHHLELDVRFHASTLTQMTPNTGRKPQLGDYGKGASPRRTSKCNCFSLCLGNLCH